MRCILLLFIASFVCLLAASQNPSGHGMTTQLQQSINMLEKQLANAKKNNAAPAKIKELSDQIKSAKLAFSSIEQLNAPAPNQSKADPGPKWTGYLRAVKKSSSTFPVSSREANIELNFTEAIPTLYRDFNENEELNFTDDKGIGTVKDHAVITIGTETYTCDCNGNGAAELHEVAISLSDSTYSIQGFAPPCKGGTNTDGSCGMTWDVSISNQKLTNAKVLSGTVTQESDISGITGTVTSSWYLVRKVNAELIVTPEDYDNWMPEPGEDENTVGSTINLKLKLQGKNGNPLTHKAVRFELQLMQTSREPGITINYPKKPQVDLPDIRFMEQPNATIEDEFQRMKIDCDQCTTGNVTLGSFDGGGYTTFTAVAVLEDSSRIKGTLLVHGGPVEIPVPKRNPGSVIAIKWASQYNNPADMDDNETSDGNKNNGDGFTAYEEYRGVMSEGNYKRLDPKKKELAARIKRSELQYFSEGLDWFKNASDIEVVRFYLYEVADSRRINFNVNYGHNYDQYALLLDKGSLPDNQAGKAFTSSDHADIPANTRQVVIALNNIHQNYLNWSGWTRANNLQLLWTEKEYIAQTVAHEIGHGVNVWHHGDGDGLPHLTAKKGGAPIFHIFDRNSGEITTREFTVVANDRICEQGTQTSGDITCVMAYIDVCDWVQINYKDGSIGLFQSPLLPIGNKFCRGKNGTNTLNNGTHTVSGVAYENYFGKASNGECLGQIKLK